MIKVIDLNKTVGGTSPAIHCPACKSLHVFDDRWNFNGNYESPTFTPSMLVEENPGVRKMTDDIQGHRCHSFVTDGFIKFLGDCTHKMKSQTVELGEV